MLAAACTGHRIVKFSGRSWCLHVTNPAAPAVGRASLSRWIARARAGGGRVAERQTRWLQVPVSARTWGFKSPLAHQCDVARHRRHLEPLTRLWWGLGNGLGLVVDVWVEDQLSDDLAGSGVDDADVEAV